MCWKPWLQGKEVATGLQNFFQHRASSLPLPLLSDSFPQMHSHSVHASVSDVLMLAWHGKDRKSILRSFVTERQFLCPWESCCSGVFSWALPLEPGSCSAAACAVSWAFTSLGTQAVAGGALITHTVWRMPTVCCRDDGSGSLGDQALFILRACRFWGGGKGPAAGFLTHLSHHSPFSLFPSCLHGIWARAAEPALGWLCHWREQSPVLVLKVALSRWHVPIPGWYNNTYWAWEIMSQALQGLKAT